MIRAFEESDYRLICSWWHSRDEIAPLPGMMNQHCTFVYVHEGRPILSLCVYITLSNLAYIEGFISDPETPKELRRAAGSELWDYCFEFAEEQGVKHAITYASKDGLVKRYEEFGMKKSINGLTVLYKNLGV